jgi:hypothetical protein
LLNPCKLYFQFLDLGLSTCHSTLICEDNNGKTILGQFLKFRFDFLVPELPVMTICRKLFSTFGSYDSPIKVKSCKLIWVFLADYTD